MEIRASGGFGMSEPRQKWSYGLLWPLELADDLIGSLFHALRVLAGGRLPPGPERGFRRLVFPFSVAIFILSFYFRLPLINDRFQAHLAQAHLASLPTRPLERAALAVFSAIPDLAMSVAFAAVPSVIFFLARWIARGFRG